MKNDSHIDFDKLANFIAGEATDAEKQYWTEWINADKENRRIYLECLKLLEPDPHFSTNSGRFNSVTAWEKVKLQTFESDEQGNAGQKAKVLPMRRWLQYAAIFILAGALISYWVNTSFFSMIEINQASGVQEYYLPDSSKVVLRGTASIRYDREFRETGRQINLTGQGYFDVRRLDGVPFEVLTPRGIVKVLGTAFLVEENAESIMVVVDLGVVELSLKNEIAALTLEKNEKGEITFDKKIAEREDVNNLNTLYWANRKLSYRRATLPDVFDELSEIFKVQFDYDQHQLRNCKITAIFRDLTLEQIMENIALSNPISYTISGDMVKLESEGCNAD